ncbi:hypothetical protein P9F15_29570 [Bacillus cereus]|nr:hypothetical protein [Bacillus cereus]
MSLWSVAGNVFIVCLIAVMVLVAVLICTFIVLSIQDLIKSFSGSGDKKINENDEKICLEK